MAEIASTLGSLLAEAAQDVPDKVFLYCGETQVTYRELNERSSQVANAFLQSGIRKGDKIALYLPNCPEFLYVWFGAARIGAIIVPANTALKEEELSYVIEHSEAATVVSATELVGRVLAIRDQCPLTERIICVGDPAPPDTISFSQFIQGAPSTRPDIDITGDDLVCILYTSGTTGRPKGVMLHHYAYTFTGQAWTEHLGWNSNDVVICMLPLFHINAQVYSTVGTLTQRASVVLLERFSASRFWDDVRRYTATIFVAMPTIALMLYNQPEQPGDADNMVRQVVTALPRDIYEKFEERFGVDVVTGYSLTENMLAFLNPLDRSRRKINSIGFPLPHGSTIHEAKIFDDNDQEVPRGAPGELVVRGPAIMKGYYKNPEATAEALRNGWLHTGDFAYQDEQGYIYFLDRKKDIVRRGGENISSQEVEAVLNSHPKVAEAAVVPVPDPVWEEEVKAYIVPKAGEEVSPEEIIAYCEQKLAKFKIPRYIEFRQELPHTPTMRVQKNVLKAEKKDLAEGCWDRMAQGK